jgi:hypothetical protein
MKNFSQIAAPAPLGHLTAFTPQHLENQKPKPVFWLRSGSFAERCQYTADLSEHGAGDPHSYQFDEAFKDGLLDRLPDNDDQPENASYRAEILDHLQVFRSGQELDEKTLKFLNDAWTQITSSWGPLARLVRQRDLRAELLPAFALKYYCVKFENMKDRNGQDIAFEKDEDGRLSDSILMKLSNVDLESAGIFANNLQFGGGVEKNSESPSSLEGEGENSMDHTAGLGASLPQT